MSGRPRMLVLTHVHPFPGSAGQQQRVRYTLEAARARFHVTVLTCAPAKDLESVRASLAPFCDASVVLPALYARTPAARLRHRAEGVLHALVTGEKRTNYDVGSVELSPSRVAAAIRPGDYDVALFEYWYASRAASVFRRAGVPCVLDMHNILWKAYERQMAFESLVPAWAARLAVARYRAREERAWREFDGLAAINREEEAYVNARLSGTRARIFHAPMGVDLSRWPARWSPPPAVRIGFYGGLGSRENEDGALRCHDTVMPLVWERFPDAELWLVGSNPTARLRALARDPRVKVTGFVRDVGETLASLSCVVCPWSGTYGFRSRVVEVMSVGVPTVASRDAVWGMELADREGILLGDDDAALARLVLELLGNEELAREQGGKGRCRVASLFTVDLTYGRWVREMESWIPERAGSAA